MMAIRNPGNKKFHPYQEGDLVWIEGTNLKTLYPLAKLALIHYGPFEAVIQLSPAVYSIKLPCQWKIHNVFHANLITPYKEMAVMNQGICPRWTNTKAPCYKGNKHRMCPFGFPTSLGLDRLWEAHAVTL